MDATGLRINRAVEQRERDVSNLAAFVRAHVLTAAIVLAFALGLMAPRWWVLGTDPPEGVRVAMSPFGASRIGFDESLYTSSIRQVMDGDFPVRDPYLEDRQDSPAQPSTVWHSAIGFLARATGDVFSSLAIVTTIAAVAGIGLLYLLLFQITGSRWAALALIPIIMMAIHVFNQADNIFALRRWYILKPIITIDPQREWHAWLRYPAPIMVLAPFFAAVIAFPRAIESGSRAWIAAAAGAFAILIYSYLFYWTAMLLAVGAWGAWMAFDRDWASLRRLALVSLFAALLALPEFSLLARGTFDLPADTRDRLGLDGPGVDLTVFRALAQRVLVGLPFVAILALRGSRRERFYIALLVAPIVLAGVTGVVPQPWHYVTQVWGVFAIPAIVAGAVAFVRMVPGNFRRAGSLAFAALAVVAIAHFAIFQARAIRHTDASFAVTADEHAALSWIDDHVTSAETVASPSITTNLYLASLTPADEYIAEGGFSKATDAELIDRMLRVQAAFGYSEDDVFSRLDVTDDSGGFPVNDNVGTPAQLERKLERFLAFYTLSFEITDQSAFDARVETWRPTYRSLTADHDVLAPYAADYLYCGQRERIYGGGTASPGTMVMIAFEEGDVTIYRRVEAGSPGARSFTGC